MISVSQYISSFQYDFVIDTKEFDLQICTLTLLVALPRFGAAKALICVIWGIAAGSRSQLQSAARVDGLEMEGCYFKV